MNIDGLTQSGWTGSRRYLWRCCGEGEPSAPIRGVHCMAALILAVELVACGSSNRECEGDEDCQLGKVCGEVYQSEITECMLPPRSCYGGTACSAGETCIGQAWCLRPTAATCDGTGDPLDRCGPREVCVYENGQPQCFHAPPCYAGAECASGLCNREMVVGKEVVCLVSACTDSSGCPPGRYCGKDRKEHKAGRCVKPTKMLIGGDGENLIWVSNVDEHGMTCEQGGHVLMPGKAGPGKECQTVKDCRPYCCNSGEGAVLIAMCEENRCASETSACTYASWLPPL